MRKSKLVLASLLLASLSLSAIEARAQSLAQALAAAYTVSPELESALLEIKQSAENIALSQAQTRPTIGASLDGNASTTLNNGIFANSQQLNAGVSINQTIFDNNRTNADIEQARALADLSKFQMANTEQNILLSVAEAYMNVLRDSQLISLRQDNVSFFQAQLQSSQDRLEVGEGTRIDVAQAQARLAQAQASLQAAQNSLQTSRATFQRYVGSPPNGLAPTHGFGQLIPRTIDEAISIGESQHPAIRVAQASIRAAQAASDAARAEFGPTVTVNGQLGTGYTTQLGNTGINGRVGFSLTIPIYSGGAIGAGIRRANLAQIQSEVDTQTAYNQIREAVISSWSGIQNADAQITSAQAAVAAGQQVVDGVIQERDLGTRTTLDVLNAQAELISAREALITASNSRVIAQFSLLAAIGRLNARDLGLAVEVRNADAYVQTVQDVWQELRAVED
jgi:outer membrane protein